MFVTIIPTEFAKEGDGSNITELIAEANWRASAGDAFIKHPLYPSSVRQYTLGLITRKFGLLLCNFELLITVFIFTHDLTSDIIPAVIRA